MRKKKHPLTPSSELVEAYKIAVELFGEEAIEQYTPVRDTTLRRRFKAKFDSPDVANTEPGKLVGPYQYWGRELFWRYNEQAEAWEAVEHADYRTKNYDHRRWQVVTLADEHRDRMEQDELIAFLIHACIVTGLVHKPDIVEVIEVTTSFEEEEIDRVLKRHRGKSAARPMWWVDRQKVYHLFDD
jgi:hypothetical protein